MGMESGTDVYKRQRKTVYSWLNTYNKASKDEVSGIKIFEEKYVKGSFHPRSLTPDIEHRLLNLVLNHPELSIHKLSDTVGISSFSIWKILKRHKLTSYQSRYLYANRCV